MYVGLSRVVNRRRGVGVRRGLSRRRRVTGRLVGPTIPAAVGCRFVLRQLVAVFRLCARQPAPGLSCWHGPRRQSGVGPFPPRCLELPGPLWDSLISSWSLRPRCGPPRLDRRRRRPLAACGVRLQCRRVRLALRPLWRAPGHRLGRRSKGRRRSVHPRPRSGPTTTHRETRASAPELRQAAE